MKSTIIVQIRCFGPMAHVSQAHGLTDLVEKRKSLR
jgi:hypothetical protein